VIGHDPVSHSDAVLPAAEDAISLAVQELRTAGYHGLDDYFQHIDGPVSAVSGGVGQDDGGPFNVHPPDNRQVVTNTRVYPWRATGKLLIRFPSGATGWGSGALIDPYHFLTAGHNVYDSTSGGWATNLDVDLGLDGTTRPFGEGHWTYARTYTNWVNSGDPNWDFSLITLDRQLGNFVGWLGFYSNNNDNFYRNLSIQTAGYPGDLSNGDQMYYWAFDKNADHADTYHVYYHGSTFGGQSGSGVWMDDGSYRIINVHAYGADPNNFGTRITEGKYNDLTSWITDDNAHRAPNDRADLTDYDSWFHTTFNYFTPGTVQAGQTMTAGSVVENIGTRDATAFTTRFYISTNRDLYLGTNYLLGDVRLTGGCPALGWREVVYTGAVPNVPAGRYFINCFYDLNNEIPEFDKSNNVGAVGSSQLLVRPAAPNLSASTVSSSRIQLSWSSSPGATSYSLERRPSGSSGWSVLAPTGSTSYLDTGLVAGNTYFYRVRAYNGASGYGDYSLVRTASTRSVAWFNVTASPTTIVAGNTTSVIVTAIDTAGSTADGYRGTITFTPTDTRGTVPSPYTFVAADNGVHTFTNGVTLRTAGVQSVQVADGSINGSVNVTVNPATVDHFVVSASSTAPTAGSPFSVTVTAQDQYNNTVTSYAGTVSFSSSDIGSATALPPDSLLPGGSATFTNGVTLSTAGVQSVRASDGGITGSVNVNVNPAALALFVVTTSVDGSSTTAGTPFNVTVTAYDAYANVATNYASTVHFRSADPYPATLPADSPLTNGTATFSGATLYTVGSTGTQDVTVRDNGGSGITASDIVTVTPATAVAFVVTPSTYSTTVGTPISFTITAVDPYGNTDVNYLGPVAFSSADPTVVFSPPSYTFRSSDAGVAFFSAGATFNQPDPGTGWDLTVTDPLGRTGSATIFVM
jgi:V8-like Glu-specific endopeptidase